MFIQQDLFSSNEELERLTILKRLDKLEESQDKGRRSQFAKIGELAKKIAFLETQINLLEMLCQKTSLPKSL